MSLDAALVAAKRGMHVFPVFFKNGTKHPAVKWRDEATTDIEQIYAWWSGRSYPAYGIECEKSGIIVVDEDTLGEFQRLAERLGQALPDTYVVRTGRATGGRQFQFTNPLGIRSTELRSRGFDIDIKGAGGYVVGVGSGHPSGATYTMEIDVDRAPFPGWLAEWLTQSTNGKATGWTDPTIDALLENGVPIGQAQHPVLRDVVWDLRSTQVPRSVAKLTWKAIVNKTVLTKPREPWTEEHFDRYWDGADQKMEDPPEVTVIEDGVRSSWSPVDLTPYLNGQVVQAEPTVGLARSDGLRLLYPGKEHTVIGEMESGKSWLACACCAAELNNGHRVLCIHFEEADPASTIERLQAIGVRNDTIATLFTFVGPDEPVTEEKLASLLAQRPSLVVLDGVNEAMDLHELKIREESGAATFRRLLVKPCTAVGAATLAADHVVKDRERRGRDALGSVHKGNGLTGALILLENAEPFGRDLRGRSHLFITKDRPGHLRRNGRPGGIPGKTFLGELVVDDTRTMFSYLDLAFWAATDRADERQPVDQDAADEAAVLSAVTGLAAKGKQTSTRTIRAAVKGMSNERIDMALTRLTLADRLVETAGSRNARLFTVPEDQSPS